MKKFEMPTVELVEFDSEDIIATSEKCTSSYSYGYDECIAGSSVSN